MRIRSISPPWALAFSCCLGDLRLRVFGKRPKERQTPVHSLRSIEHDRWAQAGFAQKVEDTYGKENIVVVHHSKSGRGIRFWDKDYRFPDGYRLPGKGVPSERSKQQHGQEYGPLIGKVREAIEGKSFDTVTFVWMQGESDGGRGLGPVYEESFLRLLRRIKQDLERKDLGFVIGRINNSRMSDPNWKAMRDAQVKLAEDTDHGEWIDTDDLSGPEHGVHFPKENYSKLGQRFAEKAIDLIRKRN